jgi:phosphoribosylformylglycinamidine synthase
LQFCISAVMQICKPDSSSVLFAPRFWHSDRMLELAGAPALSAFRLDKLLRALKAHQPGVTPPVVTAPVVIAIDAHFVHFIDTRRPLTADERKLLARLLTYGPRLPDEAVRGALVLVIPRPGTISPWSSKATDIAHVCGLDAIDRIERGIAYRLAATAPLTREDLTRLAPALFDRMTETAVFDVERATELFARHEPRALTTIPLGTQGLVALKRANAEFGLALSDEEIDYLATHYHRLERDPSDVELMMFAQANSEHCRHKIFNAEWIIDGERQAKSLFAMIRNTHERNSRGVLSAYRDNAAVLAGPAAGLFSPQAGADGNQHRYEYREEPADIVLKVETHNHPTAISPFPGAATGSGGELRDEGATGRGARPKAGLVGFTVSNLRIPEFVQPWEEEDNGKSPRIASALDIMLDGPIGAAAFNNEFGRPNIAGYFRTYEQRVRGNAGDRLFGYHKPIMIAGGVGNIRRAHVTKSEVSVGARIVVLGGPAMLIGLGGGATSSITSGLVSADLDFASVQRGNAEMQRRAQEVINHCAALGARNPILLIHDVGAGGLANAVPEAVAHSRRGGRIALRAVPNAEPGMSPMELWCNEAQERYVLAIEPEAMDQFAEFCRRERCPYADIGVTTSDGQLVVEDAHFGNRPVDLPVDVLLGKPPRMTRDVKRLERPRDYWDASALEFGEAVERVLRLPAVADKSFLITIGDRTVGGLICRDQMVGPWQVPVSDVAVTANGYRSVSGEAMAMGERTPIAVLDGPASGRIAVGEAITNILAADIGKLGDIRLSANWMAACGEPGEDAELYATVRAVGEEFCPALGITIPVGKDSLSMRSTWTDASGERSVEAPVSLVVSAFAPVADVRRTWTPELRSDAGDTQIVLIDLGAGRHRLGGSALAQVYGRIGAEPADADDPERLIWLAAALADLRERDLVLAYHDRSDGGLFVTLCEMAFAGHCAFDVELPRHASGAIAQLFSEELGVVLQIRAGAAAEVQQLLARHGLGEMTTTLGRVKAGDALHISAGPLDYRDSRTRLHRLWSETSFRLQALRDDPDCAREEREARADIADPGLNARLAYDPGEDIAAPFIARGARPRVAVLREQGVNGHVEMAAAFERAGFDSHDVHMSDILGGRASLEGFHGVIACGGFSYGDVLGAGEGWAKAILFNARARDQFVRHFERRDAFTLGVCNGCQMLAALRELIPGTEHWPRFVRNRSEQFEARLSLVEIVESPSVLFRDMQGTVLPIAVAHGEGRAEFAASAGAARVATDHLITMRFVDNYGRVATRYPANPNGSPLGIAGLTTSDGRVTVSMPHPERVFRTVQNSWHPAGWGEDGGWLRLFRNARVWLG